MIRSRINLLARPRLSVSSAATLRSRTVNRFTARFNSTKQTTPPNASSSAPKSSASPLVSFVVGVTLTGLIMAYGPQLSTKSSDEIIPITELSQLTPPKYATPDQLTKAFAEITAIVGEENVSNKPDVFDTHSDTFWNTHHAKPDERPQLVVYPSSTEEVSEIMKICTKYKVPIVPFAGGTSLEGHFTPIYGGISLDFTNMSKILQLHKEDLDIVVQPGLGWEELDDYLEDYELAFGPDPGPGAQISGMIGTGCSGTNAYRYGTMRDNVLNLTVVLSDGSVIKTRQRPRKSSAGYNLTQLFIGSEGTLGIVTEATLKLVPRPQNEGIAMVTFNSIKDAAAAAAEVVQAGLQVGAIEILDDVMMKAVNDAGQTRRKWIEKPTIAFKFSGSVTTVKDMISQVKAISKSHNNQSFDFATSKEQREELWAARKAALWSTIEVAPKGHHAWTTDVAVPMSNLPQIINETKKDIVDSGLFGTIVGHVGDGNFHTILMYDPNTERDVAEGVVHRMVNRALELDGTCTGEHGVGVGKKLYLAKELGPGAVGLMRRLKLTLDPLCILNPDKVVTVNPLSPELGD